MSSPLASPTVEPIICQPWCQDGHGHAAERAREDQWCIGIEHRVTLSTEPTMLMSNGSIEQQHLNTFLLRQADDTAPRVFIGSNEGSGKSATFDEARQFALEILARTDGYGD
jgi:hypothetical protein